MDPEDADPPPEARPPLLEDLVSLCRNLNREGARYVVIGGMAIIQAGFGRATNEGGPGLPAAAASEPWRGLGRGLIGSVGPVRLDSSYSSGR